MAEVEIKKGLVGVIADETKVSEVMPDINSLTYRGYAVQDLAEACVFEEVAYLLLNGELPNKSQLAKFQEEERNNREISSNLKKVIQKAKAGQTIFNADVFFGNEESNPIKTVSTVISNKRRAKVHNNKNVSAVMVWPIKIAFYSRGENKTSPDYEISLELDEVGVVYSYKVDYGDFEVIAKLKDFKVIEKQVCNN